MLDRPIIWLEGGALNQMILVRPPRKREYLGIEFNPMANDPIVNHAFIMKPQSNTLDTEVRESFSDWWYTLRCWKSDTSWGHRIFMFETLPGLISLHWLVLICIFYSKIITAGTVLPWVLWAVLVNYWTWESSGNPKVLASWSKGWVVWESQSLQLMSEVRGVLWRTVVSTCEIWPNFR